MKKIQNDLKISDGILNNQIFEKSLKNSLEIEQFSIEYGPLKPEIPVNFSFDAPTCKENIFRVARAMLSAKPIMLEGSPGAGKSSLIVALAVATGNPLIRLNLSDQTVNFFYGFKFFLGSMRFVWQRCAIDNGGRKNYICLARWTCFKSY